MQWERRRWCCPICGGEFRIPVAVDDPMACPQCADEPLPDGGWIFESDGTAESPRPDSTAQPQSAFGPFEWRPDDFLQDEWSPRNPQSGSAAAGGEQTAAEAPPARPKRRSARVVASTLLAGTVLAVLLGLRPYPWGGIFQQPPELQRNPNEAAPLAALVEFTTHVPAVATIELDDGRDEWTWQPDGPPSTEHRVAVVGLRPDRMHKIRVRVESSGGWFAEVSDPLMLMTPPLPDDFPPLKTVVSQPEAMEPGTTLLAVNRWWHSQRDANYGYVVILNQRGEVVWYFRAERGTADMRLLSNGRLLCNDTNYRQMVEVDLLGNVVRTWQATGLPGPQDESAIPLDLDTLHHEVLELPSGNFLALSTELRRIDEFPASETDPHTPWQPANVVGDVIVEFQPDGGIVREWNLFDLLDARRIGYGSLSGFWDRWYHPELYGKTRDWTHANAICYDPRDDSMIVSLRHQDCLVKIDRGSGRLVWILGDPAGWREPWSDRLLEPKGDLQWPYHQHAAQLTDEGTIMLYDNGNYRAVPFAPPVPAAENYSRVVEFRVDEAAGTVEQVWEYRGPEGGSFFSPFFCEAEALPQTGNVLITDGGRIETADGIPSGVVPSDYQWARLLEVTRGASAETVFEVVIDSGLGSPEGWSVYRSERLPDVPALSDLASGSLNGN